MDKVFKTKLFTVYKQEDINKFVKQDELKKWMKNTIHYLKTCYYNGNLDIFIKYINEIIPEVDIVNLVFSFT